MASLETLEICGIRSFGPTPRDIQYLHFGKPLTVINGINGSGKSTVIEALRYITSQKEPSGKGTFVHDPDLAKTKIVKAFIKLKLRDAQGREIHLSKAVQAQRTAKATSMKVLDSTISFPDKVTKAPNTISNRCVDFAHEILRIFGVSKAILENVIFCTQEDSYWPLETDQKLKEKFDQIFDSEKYNKCVKKVRDQRKRMMEDNKVCAGQLKYLKENKVAAQAKKKELVDLETKIEKLNQQIEKLESDLEPTETSLKLVYDKENQLWQIDMDIKNQKVQLENLNKSINELEKKIKSAKCRFEGSDADLERALQECNREASSMDELKKNLAALQRQEHEIVSRKQAHFQTIGQMNKLSEINKKHLNTMSSKMSELATQLGITVTPVSIKDLEDKMSEKKNDLSDLKIRLSSLEADEQKKVDVARGAVIVQETKVKQKEEELDKNKREIKKIQNDLDDMLSSQKTIERLSTQLNKITQELVKHQNSLDPGVMKYNIADHETQLLLLEEKIDKAENDVTKAQESTAARKEVEMLESALEVTSKDIQRLRSRHESTLKEVLGNVPDYAFKHHVESKYETQESRLTELTTKQARKEKELASMTERRSFLAQSIKEKQTIWKECSDQVIKETGGEDWDQCVEEMQRIVDDLQEAKGILNSSSCMYKRYISQLKKTDPCCPLCTREFAVDKEALNLAATLKAKMEALPEKLEENCLKLSEKQEKLNRLRALHSVNKRIIILKNEEIPSLNKQLEDTDSNISKLKLELEQIVVDKRDPENIIEKCKAMIVDLGLLDKTIDDHDRQKREVKNQKSRLPSNAPSLSEAQTELSSLRSKRQLDKTAIAVLKDQLTSYNERLSSLERKKHELTNELSAIEGGASSRAVLANKLEEAQVLEAVLRNELKVEIDAVSPCKKALTEAQDSLRRVKGEHSSAVESSLQKLSTFCRQLDEIRRLKKETLEYQSEGNDRKVEELQSKLDRLEKELVSVKTEMESISVKVGSLANNEVRRRELEDNKSVRLKLKEKEEIEIKITNLKKNCGEMDYEELQRKKQQLKIQEGNIRNGVSSINGKLGALKAQKKALDVEIKKPMLCNAEKDYRKAFVEHRVGVAMVGDLLRYATAMEYAMSQYHKKQMQRVNEFVREYWRLVYKGNDIEFIEIQADEVEVSDKKRNYSYRLVMVKKNVRMDMRNRCSAGQRMLACLIIRISLAEVFSSNCGILTLDEPTTNLDAKNIASLAEMLNEIVNAKQRVANSNLQLVVISHDENFVQRLMEFSGLTTCIKIYRGNSGRSRVKHYTNEESFAEFEGRHYPDDSD